MRDRFVYLVFERNYPRNPAEIAFAAQYPYTDLDFIPVLYLRADGDHVAFDRDVAVFFVHTGNFCVNLVYLVILADVQLDPEILRSLKLDRAHEEPTEEIIE